MVLVVYVSGEIPEPVANALVASVSGSESARVLFVSHSGEKLKDAIEWLNSLHPSRSSGRIVLPKAGPLAQASDLVCHIQSLVQVDGCERGVDVPIVLLATEVFPAALFTCTLSILRDEPPPGCTIHILDPSKPDPYVEARDDASRKTVLPKNSAATLEWQDLEFRQDLLDSEEHDHLRQAALFGRSVLILGPKGTGKTLLARFLHFHTKQSANGKFVEQNMAAVPETLFDGIFYGVAPGAATGVSESPGLCMLASGGTLFLDEIAEVSTGIQAKLLRIVSERVEPINLPRVGESSMASRPVSPRFVAATNRPLSAIQDPESPLMRPDLLSRFPARIHLKRLY